VEAAHRGGLQPLLGKLLYRALNDRSLLRRPVRQRALEFLATDVGTRFGTQRIHPGRAQRPAQPIQNTDESTFGGLVPGQSLIELELHAVAVYLDSGQTSAAVCQQSQRCGACRGRVRFIHVPDFSKHHAG
jgi:hypothetical protein